MVSLTIKRYSQHEIQVDVLTVFMHSLNVNDGDRRVFHPYEVLQIEPLVTCRL